MRLIACLLLCAAFAQAQPKPKEIYRFVNTVYANLLEPSPDIDVYFMQEEVLANQLNPSESIFNDKVKLLGIRFLDSLLTGEDIQYMRTQAERPSIERWNAQLLKIGSVALYSEPEFRRRLNKERWRIGISMSPPLFSADHQKAIVYIRRHGFSEGWETVLLYQFKKGKWKLVRSKLNMWHLVVEEEE